MITSGTISIFLLLLTTFVANIDAQKNVYPLYQWNYLDYQFPTAAARSTAINNKDYVVGSPFIIDVDVYNGATGQTIFVTTPRFFQGSPATVGTLTGVSSGGGPVIAPFPNYSWHQSGTGNCNGFTNVVRIFVDECQRLWVLDSGVIDTQTCPAKLVLFDLRSPNATPFTHTFSNLLYRNTSQFITPIVDSRNCYDSMVYIADVTGFGIIVYDYKNNRSWRTESPDYQLRPIEQNSHFLIAGERFDLMDGVFGMAVSPKTYTNRQLFFHPLASYQENRIPLSILDTPSYWPTSYPQIMNPNQYVQMGLRQNTQATVQAMDRYGNLFFGTITPPGIGCWDSNNPYVSANLKLVVRNDVTLQFISGLKIVITNNIPELWVSSCRFQKIMAGTRNMNEPNYRIQKIPISELLGTNNKCVGVALQ